MSKSFQYPWPIEWAESDKHGGSVVAYFAEIKTGVCVFCVEDWKRGEDERDGRATGRMGTRLTGKIVRIGRCKSLFGDECYPNLRSAEMRWRGLTKLANLPPEAPNCSEVSGVEASRNTKDLTKSSGSGRAGSGE